MTLNDQITGTATDASNNTSEFGANVTPQPLSIVKRAFTLDGTAVPSGAILPKGAVFKFLLYINNPGGAVSDVSLSDALEAAFEYQGGSIRYDDSQPACSSGTCTPAEEAAIFAATGAGTAGTDAEDGDPVSRAATTIHVGDAERGQRAARPCRRPRLGGRHFGPHAVVGIRDPQVLLRPLTEYQ